MSGLPPPKGTAQELRKLRKLRQNFGPWFAGPAGDGLPLSGVIGKARPDARKTKAAPAWGRGPRYLDRGSKLGRGALFMEGLAYQSLSAAIAEPRRLERIGRLGAWPKGNLSDP